MACSTDTCTRTTGAARKERAAAEGKSLSAYVAAELGRIAARPTNAEIVARLRERDRASGPSAADIVEALSQHVTLTLAPGPEAPAAVQLVAYRVVQEGLTNAMRHAGGAPVTVSVGAEGGAMAVEVVDTGDQAAPPVEGNGLRGLRERVQGVGGSLDVALTGARGARLRAVLPYAEAP